MVKYIRINFYISNFWLYSKSIKGNYKIVQQLLGKIKNTWSGCPHGFWACWICWAYRTMLGQDLRGQPQFAPKDVWFLMMGFANLHLLKNGFAHYIKYALNKDIKSHECL